MKFDAGGRAVFQLLSVSSWRLPFSVGLRPESFGQSFGCRPAERERAADFIGFYTPL